MGDKHNTTPINYLGGSYEWAILGSNSIEVIGNSTSGYYYVINGKQSCARYPSSDQCMNAATDMINE